MLISDTLWSNSEHLIRHQDREAILFVDDNFFRKEKGRLGRRSTVNRPCYIDFERVIIQGGWIFIERHAIIGLHLNLVLAITVTVYNRFWIQMYG